MTRPPALRPTPAPFARRRRGRSARRRDDEDPDLPDQVRIALRVEAPGEVLEGGGVVVVLQAHDVDDDTHFVDADQLWLGEGARLLPPGPAQPQRRALRAAAEVWPPLDRLQRQQVPDRMVLDADELADLLEHGLEALDGVGIDVFWPRGLRGELIPQARVEVATGPTRGPADGGPVRARGAVRLRLAARPRRRPAHRRRDGRARRAPTPGDPAARQLDGHRPGRGPPGAQAGQGRPARSSRWSPCRPR